MTLSQMTATSTEESHQQRLHWLAEQVLNWSGLPVVHIRPTVFLDTPLFTTMVVRSIQENGTIALPFDTGRTSPVAVDDVARVAATVLRDPAAHIGHVYELTGPHSVDMTELAAAFSLGPWVVQCPMWTCSWTGGRSGSPGWAGRLTPNGTSPPWLGFTGTTVTTAQPTVRARDKASRHSRSRRSWPPAEISIWAELAGAAPARHRRYPLSTRDR